MYKKLPNGQIVYEEDYSCVLDPVNGIGGIFIGNLEAAQNIKTLKSNLQLDLEHNIRAVLTAAKGVNITHPKSQIPFYLQIPGQDRDGFDLTRYFSQAINFIRDSLENTNIMVHCLAGVSRSVCLVLAYLIKCRQMSYQQAYDIVKSRRKIVKFKLIQIHPNDGFIRQLKNFQLTLDRKASQPVHHQKGYSASPTKRRYEYFNQIEDRGEKDAVHTGMFNYQERPRSSLYESPSKIHERTRMIDNYIPTHKQYESPVKRAHNYQRQRHYSGIGHKGCDSTSKYSKDYRREISPTKRQYQYKYENSFSPSKTNLRRLCSYDETLEYNQMNTEIVPNKMFQNGITSYRNQCSNMKPEPKRLFGDNAMNVKYGIGDISPTELSEELDRKIAKIRQKYAEYTKDSKSYSNYGKESVGFDENNIYGQLSMKKMSSDVEPSKLSKFNPEIGLIRSTYMKGSGLDLKRLSSLKQGYQGYY